MHILADASLECPNCKAGVPETSQFCPQCGFPLTEDAKAHVRYKTPGWAILVLILFLALLAYVGFRTYNDIRAAKPSARVEPPATQIIPPQPPASRSHSIPLTNGAVAVKAGSYAWYPFAVPAGATGVTVSGHFTAAGGTRNDIQVYILDEDGFVNFKNEHTARTFYNSGKVTQAAISAVLPNTPASYYLLFDNRFSPDAPKAVQVSATLSYMQ
ncbi:MAG TPA: zinc-ribbon domain-containing protein [Pyrinomonadaceae bacterium]|jgi:hypothetical protein